jgi:hypothetical protein
LRRSEPTALAAPFEILHRLLVFFRGAATRKRAEISPFAGFWIYFARIKTILARPKFSNHGLTSESFADWYQFANIVPHG